MADKKCYFPVETDISVSSFDNTISFNKENFNKMSNKNIENKNDNLDYTGENKFKEENINILNMQNIKNINDEYNKDNINTLYTDNANVLYKDNDINENEVYNKYNKNLYNYNNIRKNGLKNYRKKCVTFNKNNWNENKIGNNTKYENYENDNCDIYEDENKNDKIYDFENNSNLYMNDKTENDENENMYVNENEYSYVYDENENIMNTNFNNHRKTNFDNYYKNKQQKKNFKINDYGNKNFHLKNTSDINYENFKNEKISDKNMNIVLNEEGNMNNYFIQENLNKNKKLNNWKWKDTTKNINRNKNMNKYKNNRNKIMNRNNVNKRNFNNINNSKYIQSHKNNDIVWNNFNNREEKQKYDNMNEYDKCKNIDVINSKLDKNYINLMDEYMNKNENEHKENVNYINLSQNSNFEMFENINKEKEIMDIYNNMLHYYKENNNNYLDSLSEVSEITDEIDKKSDELFDEPENIKNVERMQNNMLLLNNQTNNISSKESSSSISENTNKDNRSNFIQNLYKLFNYENMNKNNWNKINNYDMGIIKNNENIKENIFNTKNYINYADNNSSISSASSNSINENKNIDEMNKKRRTENEINNPNINLSTEMNKTNDINTLKSTIKNNLYQDGQLLNEINNNNSLFNSNDNSSVNSDIHILDDIREKIDKNVNIDSTSINDIKTEDLFINSYIPYPPSKYSNIYDLHEIKILSPHILKTKFQKEQKTYHSTLKDGKLILLLDLDNTLLQATSQVKLNMDLPLENFVDENGEAQLYKFYLPTYNFYYYLKFRPYVRQFLEILSLYYELSIYTNATREYADVVIAILDPDRTLFADRIVARCNSLDRDENKHFSRIYPNVDCKYVIAFDDRKDVWVDIPPSHILKAEHYNFFELSKYDIISHFKDEATCKKKFVDMDRHLYYMTKVFLKLHKKFFENPLKVDVGILIKEIMSETLNNIGVYFTGFRKNSKNIQGVLSSDCEERQKEIALELGAKLYSKYYKKGVTHIIAAKNCTDNLIKSKQEQFNHIYKVHTLWLYHCRGTLENANASYFDIDELCKIYNNKPPLHPKKDHWFFGCKNWNKEDNNDCVKNENIKSRIFLGTGIYTHDAVIFSPFEEIHIKWIEKEVKLRQNYNTGYIDINLEMENKINPMYDNPLDETFEHEDEDDVIFNRINLDNNKNEQNNDHETKDEAILHKSILNDINTTPTSFI